MKNKLIKIMEDKNMKVVRVTKTEYELENGDIYPNVFELDEDITVEEFQIILDESKSLVLSHMKKIESNNE
jgi:L-rhamnose mutarotase